MYIKYITYIQKINHQANKPELRTTAYPLLHGKTERFAVLNVIQQMHSLVTMAITEIKTQCECLLMKQ